MLGSPGRFVLIVGDEGALLCEIRNRAVTERAFAASPSDAGQISDLLNARPRQAVSVLVDVLDIALRREAVPPVALWERGEIVRRRLARVFPGFRYFGALHLGREDGGRRDHTYLLAGVAPSTAFDSWMAFLDEHRNPIRDIALLPIEATGLMTQIVDAFASYHGNAWRVLLTRERTGGLRQVIARDGVIAFSRLTQISEPDASPEDLADTIESEFGHTVNYLKRLGFTPGDGLDLITVGDDALRAAIARREFIATQLLLVAPDEVAERLGLSGQTGFEDGFSDVLHALAYARRRRAELRMRPADMDEAQQSRRRLAAVYLTSLAIVAAAVAYLVVLATGLENDREDLIALERDRNNMRADLMALESESAALPRPLEQMVAELRTWRALRTEAVAPGTIIGRLRPILSDNVALSAIDWRLAPVAGGSRNPRNPEASTARDLSLRLTLSLAGVDADRVAAVSLGQQLSADLRGAYSDFAVSVPRLPVPIRPDETLRVEGGLDSVGRPGAPASMEVLIERPSVEAAE